jgi:replicative DNA helicase
MNENVENENVENENDTMNPAAPEAEATVPATPASGTPNNAAGDDEASATSKAAPSEANSGMEGLPNPALLGDLAGALLAEEALYRDARASGRAPGPVTGFATLDEELGSFLTPGLHPLLAAPGAGKTAFTLQVAAQCGCPALYVTSEMRRIELLRRIMARVTSTFLGKLRGGQLSHEELQARLAATARACPQLALYDATEQPISAADVQARAEALRRRFEARDVLIVIDSVTDWASSAMGEDGDGAGLTEYALAEGALNGLKQIALNLKCPVIVVAHRNRAGQNARGAAKLHSAKATGRYEYIAESVWDLERDTTQVPDSQGRTPATLTLLKNRQGGTGLSINLSFEGRLQKFTEA